jgi:hypothetical protein
MRYDDPLILQLLAREIAPESLHRIAGACYDVRQELAALALLARKTHPGLAEKRFLPIRLKD